ncbi:hypothetical protein CLV88_12150 [Shimia abyssi]|uniref:PilZ domain-containing protein n=1 Tax=Shimia abyssi TaxID=1662395 RepID=A0A2P8F5Y8_9RHOB|nr:hypothetical protein CLV88_12150 [Shimia abyssi]
MRFRFIEEHRNSFPTHRLCDVMDVSPRGLRALTPRPLSRSTCPELAPADTVTFAVPFTVFTGTLPPRMASSIEIGKETTISSPSRWKSGLGVTSRTINASPGGPAPNPGSPLPRNRRVCPSRAPSGIDTASVFPSGIVIRVFAPLTASRNGTARRYCVSCPGQSPGAARL